MNDLLSHPYAPAVLIIGALLFLIIVWKILKGALKLLVILAVVAVILVAVFQLRGR